MSVEELQQPAAPPPVTLAVTFDPATGQVQVGGPIDNKGLCYMMLECAKDAIRDHNQRRGPGGPGLVLPGMFRPNGLRG
jgi:hypothetical protein